MRFCEEFSEETTLSQPSFGSDTLHQSFGHFAGLSPKDNFSIASFVSGTTPN